MPDTHTPDNPPTPAAEAVAPGSAPGPHATVGTRGLAALRKMSTTAGLGTGEYAAVSPLAVAALVAAFLGLLGLLSDFLLVVPVVAFVLGVMAVVQIRRSNGTLTWTWAALAAVLLGLGVVGYRVGSWAYAEAKLKPERDQILATLGAFGKAVVASDHPAAYELCDPAFHARVSPAVFNGRMAGYENGVAGKLESVTWNGRLEFFAEDGSLGGPGSRSAVGGALFKFRNLSDPSRLEVYFVKTADGRWLISDLPSIFPRPPAGR